jgi:hypothetical protein
MPAFPDEDMTPPQPASNGFTRDKIMLWVTTIESLQDLLECEAVLADRSIKKHLEDAVEQMRDNFGVLLVELCMERVLR